MLLSQCVISERIPSAQNSGLCERKHCEAASCTSATVWNLTTKVLLQRAEKMKITWCLDPTQPNRWCPCCSSLNGSVVNIHCTALTSHQVTSIFFCPWRSSWCRCPGSCLRIVCWRHKCTVNTPWQTHDPVVWLCGKIYHFSLFSWHVIMSKMLLVSKYSLCILTSQLTYIAFSSCKECGFFTKILSFGVTHK